MPSLLLLLLLFAVIYNRFNGFSCLTSCVRICMCLYGLSHKFFFGSEPCHMQNPKVKSDFKCLFNSISCFLFYSRQIISSKPLFNGKFIYSWNEREVEGGFISYILGYVLMRILAEIRQSKERQSKREGKQKRDILIEFQKCFEIDLRYNRCF